MGCALTEPNNYPDYLKKILKEIDVGKDTDLKTCACSLVSPKTDDGCLAVDSNGKIGAFPSCIFNDPPEYLKFFGSLQDIMNLYWRVKKFSVSASGTGVWNPDLELTLTVMGTSNLETTYSNIFNPQPNITDQKSLVCNFNERRHEGNGLRYIITGPGGSSGLVSMSTELSFQNVFSKLSDSIYATRGGFRLDWDGGYLTSSYSDTEYHIAVGSWSISLNDETKITGTLYAYNLVIGSFNVDFTATEY
jgi:hypothetical protein